MYSLLPILLFVGLYVGATAHDPVISLPNGKIKGFSKLTKNKITFYAYIGIPFAAPPLGKLRFQPPQEHARWNDTLEVKKKDNICYQTATVKDHQTEDCLYINVVTPSKPNTKDKHPVLVDFYGGAFIHGGAYTGTNKQQYYIERGIVVVTLNYRVGPMGFLSTMDTVLPGNMGLKDQQFGLKWIQKNIHLFGGDANKVTLMGGSAGGASATYHMLSPGSAGLFRAAIAKSGSPLNTWANQRSPVESAYGIAALIDPAFNRNRSSQELLDLLQKASAEDIDKTGTVYGIFAPVVEIQHTGAFITESMYELAQRGHINKLPLITGINDEEAIYKAAKMDQWKSVISNYDRDNSRLVDDDMRITDPTTKLSVGKKIKEIYTNGTFLDNIGASIQYMSDNRYERPVIKFAELVSAHTDVWFYQFSYHGELGNNSAYVEGAGRVTHGEDGNYVWADPYKLERFPADDQLTSHRFCQLITNFVKELNPTPSQDPLLDNISWPRISNSSFYYININSTLSIEVQPRKHTFSRWVELYNQYAAKPLLSF